MIIQIKTKQNITPSGHIPKIRILITGGSGSRKINVVLNLINNQPDIAKIYLYPKDPYDAKNHYLINKREKLRLKHFNDSKSF